MTANTTCPLCNKPALILFVKIECGTKNCKNFNERFWIENSPIQPAKNFILPENFVEGTDYIGAFTNDLTVSDNPCVAVTDPYMDRPGSMSGVMSNVGFVPGSGRYDLPNLIDPIGGWIDDTQTCCSCHINPPCSYCTSLTEEEIDEKFS